MLWLFDLDNTLHDASHAILPAINANMNALLAETLRRDGLPADHDSVNALRMRYWQRYGATLLGMIRHHGVDMHDFLRAAHQFDDLPSMIRAEPGLRQVLGRLPGRKILLTNAPYRYAHQVMRHLGLQRHFARQVSIEAMRVHRRLRPKPSRHLLKKLLAREKVRPQEVVLVEDSVRTLKAAKALRMHTVFVTQYLSAQASREMHIVPLAQPECRNRPAYVDVKVKSIRQLPDNLRRLR